MSSVVVELGRSRVSHDALSPEKAAERAASYLKVSDDDGGGET
jgi:hypothetical protein